MTNTPAPTTPDWTADASGRSNSSPLFEAMIEEVARLIRQEAHFLLQGDTESVARLIMAQLAHKHGLGPARSTPAEPLDVLRAEIQANREQGVMWEPPVDPKVARWYAEGYDRGLRDADDIAARLRSPESDR